MQPFLDSIALLPRGPALAEARRRNASVMGAISDAKPTRLATLCRTDWWDALQQPATFIGLPAGGAGRSVSRVGLTWQCWAKGFDRPKASPDARPLSWNTHFG